MTRQEKINTLKKYKEFLEYLQRVNAKEEKAKVLVLTKKRNGKTYRVA